MIKHDKKLLIVDDSEIDREILFNILSNEFDIIQAVNGYEALEIILRGKEKLDAILLDVSMPILDGFSVLHFMKEKGINHIPVFLITAETTKDNVERAAQYNISEFIGKPFEREEIIKRLKLKLGVIGKHKLTDKDILETRRYIMDLEAIFKRYLANLRYNDNHYIRMADLMRILLNRYSIQMGQDGPAVSQIEIISKAAYFCDIGQILLPGASKIRQIRQEDMGSEIYPSHTTLGADIVRLNYSKNCEYFVQICADMCTHHHERYDGKGFPHRIFGNNNLIYTQMCGLVDEFDSAFYRYREHNEHLFDLVVNELAQNTGAVSQEVFSLLTSCKRDIIVYYENIAKGM